jgi:hypothetical protein
VDVEHWCTAEGCVFCRVVMCVAKELAQVCVVCLLTVSAKEQNTARRSGRWCLPRGGIVESRALGSYCWASEAVASDRER